jgi:nucleoid DNA-binding protein
MSGIQKTLEQILAEAKEKGSVNVKGFGTFNIKSVAARTRRNPKTGAAVQAPAFKKLTFKMSKGLRETL